MALEMLLLAVCVAVVVQSASAHNGVEHVTWIVGDGNGWTWPEPNGYNFTAWAETTATIKKSDKLTFNYANGTQDVLQVSATSYANCSYMSPIYSDMGLGPTNFTIEEPGDYYFVCSVDNRCAMGMKFHITALDVMEHAEEPGVMDHAHGPAPPPGSDDSSHLAAPALAAALAAMLGYILL